MEAGTFSVTGERQNGFAWDGLSMLDRKTGIRYPMTGDTIMLESAGADVGRYALVTGEIEEDVNRQEPVLIYPNPNPGRFRISGLCCGHYYLGVRENTGKEIYRTEFEADGRQPEFELILTPSTYLVEIRSSKKTEFRKLVVTH